jgi:hypothetical protein
VASAFNERLARRRAHKQRQRANELDARSRQNLSDDDYAEFDISLSDKLANIERIRSLRSG